MFVNLSRQIVLERHILRLCNKFSKSSFRIRLNSQIYSIRKASSNGFAYVWGGLKAGKTYITISQVHKLQKLKKISLKTVNFFATKTKVTCLSERVFFIFIFPSYRNFHGHVGNFICKTYNISSRLCNKILYASSINKYARSLKFRK